VGIHYQLYEGSGSFLGIVLATRGIARANRNNLTGEFAYGSYPAQLLSTRAPGESVPRRWWVSLPLWHCPQTLGACAGLALFVAVRTGYSPGGALAIRNV